MCLCLCMPPHYRQYLVISGYSRNQTIDNIDNRFPGGSSQHTESLIPQSKQWRSLKLQIHPSKKQPILDPTAVSVPATGQAAAPTTQ
ncbi:uncharacterized protein BDW47DRAFT_102543 [Aspergillus candidus]|uniref:Uncharacterized protein n=1 Tax=Aspergillus candidus TaxID=41067 RepID=A0A2I2FGU4_ASPCN|nr:hypothetical protein BDW47DRAFT_102543 [Aspergillus candidus]PLB39856.1 hypothetical protein BDW47DRAFT_102543 [Aspergillus candidus]